MLKAVPPIGTEMATLPLYLARHWLENPDKKSDDGGDAPEAVSPFGDGRGEVGVENAFRWRDGEVRLITKAKELVPGDILVLPAQIDPEQLAKLFPLPEVDAWRLDQFESAHLLSRDCLAIRFHSGIRAELKRLIPEGEALIQFNALVAPLFAHDEEEGRWRFSEVEWRNALPDLALFLAENIPVGHPWKTLWHRAAYLANGTPRPRNDWKVIPYPPQALDGVIFFNRSRVGATPWPLDPADLGQQGNQSLDEVSLEAHSQAVMNRAASNATGLSERLAVTVRDSGAWHDFGKLDPRFQAMLHGCALHGLASKTPLAKSGPRTLALQQFFSRQAELPKHFRHELLSALLIEISAVGREHPERDLLLHLIASHHGRCRAMAPAVHDPQPEPFDVEIGKETIRFAGQDCPLAQISQGVPRRFWSLNRRFGWWGLAYLETLLRLADQYESANPTCSPLI
jgi:CRISPR-associated endonuclease/helicase Cas3